MLGFRPDAADILRLLDVFVLCSINEGLPIVLLEAMSLGLPVIATKVGEIPWIIKSGVNGILVPPKDSKILANEIERLLENPRLGKKFGNEAEKLARSEYSISRMVRRYEEIYTYVQELSRGRMA